MARVAEQLLRRLCTVVGLLLGLTGCVKALPAGSRESTHQGVRFVELYTHGAGDDAPIVIAIHGRGDTPESYASHWVDNPGRIRVVLPQAPERYGFGWSWFDWTSGLSDEELSARVGAAEDHLWAGVHELAGGRRVVVTGFSQGGVLSYLAAARHPDEITLAVPMAGVLPVGLRPRSPVRAAPIRALHGADDSVIRAQWGRETVDAFKAAGAQADLEVFPGVGHSLTEELRAAMWARVQAATAE